MIPEDIRHKLAKLRIKSERAERRCEVESAPLKAQIAALQMAMNLAYKDYLQAGYGLGWCIGCHKALGECKCIWFASGQFVGVK